VAVTFFLPTFFLPTFKVKFRKGQTRQTQITSAIMDFLSSPAIPIETDIQAIPADDKHFGDYLHRMDAGCQDVAEPFTDAMEQTKLPDTIVAK
jgi:hypothetical protein